MMQRPVLTMFGMGLLATGAWAQPAPAGPAITIEQPDAERTRQELSELLQRYPPPLREVFALDPGLLTNQAYMTPYPGIVGFLNSHPEVARNPEFFLGEYREVRNRERRGSSASELWREILQNLSIFAGFSLAFGVLIWLIRTLVDYRRWSRLSKIQTEVHTKLLDRFTSNEDLLAYIQSPSGSKFLESAPISLEPASRSMGAPLGRIFWSLQAGLVMGAAGAGLQIAAGRVASEAAQPLYVLGILGIALGAGFAISAAVSFAISFRLGLIESVRQTRVQNVA